MIPLTLCKSACCTLYEKKETLCLRGSPHHSGLRTRLVLSCRAATRLSECQRRKRLFGRMERTRQRHVHTRVTVRVISSLQRLVIRAPTEQPNADPLAEEETITQFESFLCEKELHRQIGWDVSNKSEKSQSHRQLDVIRIWRGTTWGRSQPKTLFPMKNLQFNQSRKCQEQTSGSRARAVELSGDNPKEVREHARRSLEPGYYLSASGRNATRILRFLEDCYMVEEVDYVRYQFVGLLMPSISGFDGPSMLDALQVPS